MGLLQVWVDQREKLGKKSPMDKNVKDQKNVADGWHGPWILALTLPLPWRNFLVKIFQSHLYSEPRKFSLIAQSSGDSSPSMPHPSIPKVTYLS